MMVEQMIGAREDIGVDDEEGPWKKWPARMKGVCLIQMGKLPTTYSFSVLSSPTWFLLLNKTKLLPVCKSRRICQNIYNSNSIKNNNIFVRNLTTITQNIKGTK